MAHCILGKFLGVVCHCFPRPLDLPTSAARCLYVRNDARDPSSERWNCGREICPAILPKFRLPRKFRDLLHAANLRHGTDGFTSLRRKACWGFFFCIWMQANNFRWPLAKSQWESNLWYNILLPPLPKKSVAGKVISSPKESYFQALEEA